MMGWIRWTYVAPRLAALVLLAAAVHFGLPPLVRWSLTTSGQAAVGAKVEIGDVDCSLVDAKIELRDIAVADPEKPERNLFTADRVLLEVEPGSLARKRVVISRGAVEGLEFGAARDASGELVDEPTQERPAVLVKLADSAASRGEEWLSAYWSNLQVKLQEDLRKEFQSVLLAEDLVRRWPDVYAQYDARVQSLLAQGRDIEARIRAARENPLRNLADLRQSTKLIEQLNRELGELAADLGRLAPRVEQDREAVWDAWKQDEQKLQKGFAFESLDGQALGDYLLQEEVAGRLGTVVTWMARLRSLLPARREVREPERHRGVDVLFSGLQRQPDYLVRSLVLQGNGRYSGRRFDLTGTLIGLSSQPSRYGRPTVVKLAGRGAIEMEVEASFDRTGDVPLDRFAIRCPVVPRRRIELGRPDSFALGLGEGRDEISAALSLKGADLSGMVFLKMHTSRIEAASTASETTERLAESLNTSLAGLHRIDATLHVGGTLDEPTLRMESKFGDAVLASVEAAALQEFDVRRQELEQALRQHIDDKLSEVDRLVEENRRRIDQRLSEQQTTLIRLAADTIGFGDRPTIRLGSSTPGDRQRSTSGATFQR